MKEALRIAQLELRVLFYSAIAWLLLIIFTIHCGIAFAELLYAQEANQQLGGEGESLTMRFFGGHEGFFAHIQRKLYLYLPLLTMGLMSREIGSGSIKLLLSSPVTAAQIIGGKYLSMLFYGAVLMLVLLAIVATGMLAIEAMDLGYALGGVLGLYLLFAAYSAIGLFVSSLTPYQVVAAIGTFALFAALDFIGKMGQSTDFVRDITHWFSMAGRTNSFINGLVSSKDVIYFLLVMGLFLSLTIIRLEVGRKFQHHTASLELYLSLVLSVLCLGYLSSLPKATLYYDTTRFDTNTLTANSQEIVAQIGQPLELTTYTNVLNQYAHLGAPRFRNFDKRQFDLYRRYLPDMKMTYVAYYDTTMRGAPGPDKTLEERAMRAATAYGYDFDQLLSPAEIKRRIDLVPEENMMVRTLGHGEKSVFLRMFFDMEGYPSEAELSAALKRLLVSAPVIGILAENGERRMGKRGDKDYRDILNAPNQRFSLINQGFDVREIMLSDEKAIPDSLAVLVITDPMMPYSERQAQKISEYIARGGNLLLAGEPGKQAAMNELLENLGVRMMPGRLLQQSKEHELGLVQALPASGAAHLGIAFSEKDIVTMPGAAGLSYMEEVNKGFAYFPLLISDARYVWNELGNFDLNNEMVIFDPARDTTAALPLALAITRQLAGGKEQRIVVSGDADFMANAELGRNTIRASNAAFAKGLFRWFAQGEFPVYTGRPKPLDNKLVVSKAWIGTFKWSFIGGLPALLALSGTVLLLSRKRK